MILYIYIYVCMYRAVPGNPSIASPVATKKTTFKFKHGLVAPKSRFAIRSTCKGCETCAVPPPLPSPYCIPI